jgi:cholesterol transport system auxiliary component
MIRRTLLLLPLALGGCSVLPDRPNIPVRRFALNPERPSRRTAPRGAAVLLVRRVRGVPGLQELGLRRAEADGGFSIAPWDEWLAPPGDLAEAALRSWLQASGLFAAVVAPGSRAEHTLVLEAQLTALEAAPAASEARAGLAGVLLQERNLASRVLLTFDVRGRAPLALGADAPAEAAAMQAALGDAFAELERAFVADLPRASVAR